MISLPIFQMKKKSNFLAHHWLPQIFLLVISILVNYRWLNFSIFTSSDYHIVPISAFHNSFVWPVWIHNIGLGGVDTVLWRPILSVWPDWLHHAFGMPFPVYDKLFVFWPWIVISVLAPYLLVRQITDSVYGGLVGSYVFAFSTYFLAINTQGDIPLSVACGFGTLSLYYYFRLLETRKNINLLFCILSLEVAGLYDFRFSYLTLGIAFVHLVLTLIKVKDSRSNRKVIVYFLILAGTSVLLNVDWVVTLLSGGGLQEITGRGLFGAQFWTLKDAIALHHPFWNGVEPNWFHNAAIPFYFWIVPIAAIAGAFLGRKKTNVIFFACIGAIGIFLAKETNEPLGGAYLFLAAHMPGFSAFRESTKFYYYITLGYAVLIGSLAASLNMNKRLLNIRGRSFSLHHIVVSFLLAPFFINALPLISGSIGSMFIPKSVPKEYKSFNFFIDNQQSSFRVLWMPSSSRWADYSDQHPIINAVEEVQTAWKPFLDEQDRKTPEQQMLSLFNGGTNNILSFSNIKYIAVPINDTTIEKGLYSDYGGSAKKYIDILSQQNYLKRVMLPHNRIAVFLNKSYAPLVTVDTPLYTQHLSDANYLASFLQTKGVYFPTYVSTRNVENSASAVLPFKSIERIKNANSKLELEPSDSINIPREGTLSISNSAYDLYVERKLTALAITEHPFGAIKTDKGRPIGAPFADQSIKTIAIQPDESYFIEVNGKSEGLNSTRSERLGSADDVREISLSKINNTLPISQTGVGSCGAITSNANPFSITIAKPCTIRKIPIKAHTKTVFSIGYISVNNPKVSVALNYNDHLHSHKTFQLDGFDSQISKNVVQTLTPPLDATSLDINIKVTRGLKNVDPLIKISDLSFGAASPVTTILMPPTPDNYSDISYKLLPDEKNLIVEANRYSNINNIENNDFSNGAWTTHVEDCNDFDLKPEISMGLTRIKNENVLELTSLRHNACTHTNVTFNGSGVHNFSFDAQGTIGATAAYNLQFNDENRTVVANSYGISDTNWHHYSETIHVPVGATSAILTIYSYENDRTHSETVNYSNVQLYPAPDITHKVFIYNPSPLYHHMEANPQTHKISNQIFSVHIKSVKNPIMLSYADTFNAGWKLYLADSSESANQANTGNILFPKRSRDIVPLPSEHIHVNGYANGWLIDPAYIKQHYSSKYYHQNPDGSMDMNLVVYFKPQSYFYMGLVISGLTLVGIVGSLAFISWRNHKGTRPTPYKAISGYKKPLQKPSGRLRGR